MSVNASVAAICTASTNWIQAGCLKSEETVQSIVPPLEAVTFTVVVLSTLSFLTQLYEFKQFIKLPTLRSREMKDINDPEIPAVIERTPEPRNISMRIHILIRTINELFLTVVLGVGLDIVRKTATPEGCQYASDFFNNMCNQILYNVWHKYFPGGSNS